MKIIGFEDIGSKTKEYKLKVYEYNTSKDGRVDLDNYKEMMFLLENEVKDRSVLIEVKGKQMEPLFFEGDILLFEPSEFTDWKQLNKKLVAVKYKNDFLIRKLKFIDKKPFLVPFETDVEEDIEILSNENEIEFFGELTDQLKRNVSKITTVLINTDNRCNLY